MNTAAGLPMALALVPESAYGGGHRPAVGGRRLLGHGARRERDAHEQRHLQAFDDGATVIASGKATIKPFGLVGHQSVGGLWSNKTRLSLKQDPGNLANLLLKEKFPMLGDPGPILERILERFAPGLLSPARPANREDSTWAVFYAFDQYFWHPGDDQKRGIGMFFTFGASDGDANPIKYSYATGIGGNGVVPGRQDDNFGVAWARTQFSNNFVPFLRQTLNLGLDHEDAVEMFYNAAITPWLRMSLDLQVVDSGLQKRLNSSGTRLTNVDTVVVGGVRMYIRF